MGIVCNYLKIRETGRKLWGSFTVGLAGSLHATVNPHGHGSRSSSISASLRPSHPGLVLRSLAMQVRHAFLQRGLEAHLQIIRLTLWEVNFRFLLYANL